MSSPIIAALITERQSFASHFETIILISTPFKLCSHFSASLRLRWLASISIDLVFGTRGPRQRQNETHSQRDGESESESGQKIAEMMIKYIGAKIKEN